MARTITVRARVLDRSNGLVTERTATTAVEDPPARTVFGVAAPGNDLPAHRALYGQLGHVRFFFPPNKRPGWAAFPLNNRAPGDVPVVSFKTWYEPEFTAMLNTTPSDVREWWVCYYHEPEDNIADGTLTIAALETVFGRMRQLRDQHPNGRRCRIITILNWYQLTQRGFDWRRLSGVIDQADAVGVDSYSLVADSNRNIYTGPGALFAPALTIAEATGKPWAVPEFGVLMAADSNKARHAQQLQAHIDYARQHHALWVSYWCNIATSGASYHLEQALYDQALPVWKTAVRAT